jgi:outer membrane immunogenic protein
MPKLKIISSSSIAAIAAITMASGAFAADLAEPAPIEPIDIWTGFHVGIGGGGAYNMFKTNLDHVTARRWSCDSCGDGSPAWGEHLDYAGVAGHLGRASAFGTVELGYDWQFNDSFVLGVLGSFDFGKGKWAKAGGYVGESYDASYFGGDGPEVNAVAGMKVRRKNSWFVGGRLGWATSPSTLWYGVLGYTQAKLQARGAVGVEFCDELCFGDTYEVGGSKKRGGFTIGGGAETMLSENISGKLEYRYTNFKKWKGSNEFFDSEQRGLNWEYEDITAARVKMSEHSIRAVVSYRFNNLFQ